jgi:Mn2+/Fe2+ NRAMP family transporter
MDFLKINPVKALFWTAVINGLLAPFLLIGVLYVASDHKLMLDPAKFDAFAGVGCDHDPRDVRRRNRYLRVVRKYDSRSSLPFR